MAILKRQLEEKEKLLATEQEDAAVAKSKLRELNKVQQRARPVPSTPGPWPVLPSHRGSAFPPWRLARACRLATTPRTGASAAGSPVVALG